ncbi:hypothetical protein [Sutcliffiella cohnii]|uniref:hypothetical protein n=1 Tax=Sutcliffiella cohnii TaxID=33932 RepID=UPI00082B30BD|nr:hypothetical protein [Sutcliffiella cohnii]
MEFQINFSTENLHNFEDFVNVEQTDLGRKKYYKMSLNDLVKILSNSTSTGKVESPFLPRNCIKHVKTANGYEVFVDIPKQKWMINYNDNMFEVGFPRILIQYGCTFNTSKTESVLYSVEILRIFAIKGKESINGETPLYQFPYSHVESNGKVCMGGNKIRDIKNLSELDACHNIFFHSPFSHDWGAKTSLKQGIPELFASTFNQKDFDDEVLLPCERSFNEFFNLTN